MDKKRFLRTITTLRKNSRTTFARIAKKEEVATSTILSEIKKINILYIKKYACLLKPEKIGHSFQTIFYCKTNNKNRLIIFLKKIINTNNIYETSNKKIMAELFFTSLEEEEVIEEELKKMCEKITKHNIIKRIVNEQWAPLKQEKNI